MEETIIPHHHRAAHQHGMQRFLATGVARVVGRRVELEALRADGHVFPIELTIAEANIAERRVFVATLRDITAQKAAAAQLDNARATLGAIFDNIPAALYLRDRDDMLVMMNKWGAEFLGRSPEEMIGQPMIKYREPQNVDRVREVDEEIARTRKPQTHEFVYHLADGNRTGLMTFFPVIDKAGDVSHIGGMLLDVTELNMAKRQLDEARSLLVSIFDNIPAELYLRELDGSFVMMNKWGANFYGKTPDQIVGQLASEYDTGDEIEIARQAQEKLLATGMPVTQEYNYAVDGRTVKVQNTIFPVRDSQGRIVRIGGVTTDVTELYNARSQLQRAQENLHQSEKLAALGQLLAGVAHELNNPLAVVLGRAAMLQEKLKDTPHAIPLQKLREAADRCTRIVKTFLAMARQTGPRREMVEINDLIDSALEMTTYSLRKHNITWNKTSLLVNQTIEVDQDQIVQVLINLILNAQQALLEKTDHRVLDITAELCPEGQWLAISVADNGPGVPASIVNRIFDPFFTTKSVGEGTGLGLSVCKSMVEAHGGKLVLEETPGGGATFRIALPVQVAQAGHVDDSSSKSLAKTVRGRFLVIDDEVEIAAILADCLTPLGIESVLASDGKAALERLAETAFDAVFCDVSMPGMDGITFYNQLKVANPFLANRLVFISGDVLHREWDKLKAAGDRPIIEKPFDPQQVRDAALRLLQDEGGPK